MTKKTVYLLNIGNYEPEITELTYPTIEAWADKIRADVFVITERKFGEWPVTYEKLQIHELAKKRKDEWAIYLDSDALVHPELPDMTELMSGDVVAHNAVDFAPLRWTYDDYFRRDGRNIGSANWFACASAWCLDLWRPLDDLTPEEAEKNIHLTVPESRIMKPEHLIDDYALSRNIARFGLKVTTLTDLWKRANLGTAEFFFHQYLMPTHDYEGEAPVLGENGQPIPKPEGGIVMERTTLPGKVTLMRQTLERWNL